MKKNALYIMMVSLAIMLLWLQSARLGAQTQPTTADSVRKLPPQDDRPKLELPDVLIYGPDRAIRTDGEKLNSTHDDLKLIAPSTDYRSRLGDDLLDRQKDLYSAQVKGPGRRLLLQSAVGRFQQFDVLAGFQQETKLYNFSLQGSYDRNEGQFENSQYFQAEAKGHVAGRISPQILLSGQMNFMVSQYGMYAAGDSQLQRKINQGNFRLAAKWAPDANQIYDGAIYFHQTTFRDRDTSDYRSEVNEKMLGIMAGFQTKSSLVPLFVTAKYEFNQLADERDSSQTQGFLQLKSWLFYAYRQLLVVKPALVLEYFAAGDSFAKNLLVPELELTATPTPALGLFFKAGVGYHPANHSDRWSQNAFVSRQIDFIPAERQLELKFGIEYALLSRVSIRGEWLHQRWARYGYFRRELDSGLYRMSALDRVTMNQAVLRATANLSPQLTMDGGLQLAFAAVKHDTLSGAKVHLPYLQPWRIPIHVYYTINSLTQLQATLIGIGARYTSLTGNRTLSPVALLSFRLERQLHRKILGYVEGRNLLNQHHALWQGYPSQRMYFELGIKGSW
ncbi:MAG: hypothetical protein ONB27_03675 [candidate division KSB1 bacterium]|nr:hypothetical protein [candidate division KSB1 bacterium]